MTFRETQKKLEEYSNKEIFSLYLTILAIINRRNIIYEDVETLRDGFISIEEFEKKHKFVARNTLYKYCHLDTEFKAKMAQKIGGKWFVHEEDTREFLSVLPIFKKRIARLELS
jgi:hypothetical protein